MYFLSHFMLVRDDFFIYLSLFYVFQTSVCLICFSLHPPLPSCRFRGHKNKLMPKKNFHFRKIKIIQEYPDIFSLSRTRTNHDNFIFAKTLRMFMLTTDRVCWETKVGGVGGEWWVRCMDGWLGGKIRTKSKVSELTKAIKRKLTNRGTYWFIIGLIEQHTIARV